MMIRFRAPMRRDRSWVLILSHTQKSYFPDWATSKSLPTMGQPDKPGGRFNCFEFLFRVNNITTDTTNATALKMQGYNEMESIGFDIQNVKAGSNEETSNDRDVALATGVAKGTIRNSYKDLYPHLYKIIPTWYAKEEDLKNLCSP